MVSDIWLVTLTLKVLLDYLGVDIVPEMIEKVNSIIRITLL